jgi:hypothetical protein
MRSYTDEAIAQAVQVSYSIAQALKQLTCLLRAAITKVSSGTL